MEQQQQSGQTNKNMDKSKLSSKQEDVSIYTMSSIGPIIDLHKLYSISNV